MLEDNKSYINPSPNKNWMYQEHLIIWNLILMSFSHDKDVTDHMVENKGDNYKTISQRLSCYGITYTILAIYI